MVCSMSVQRQLKVVGRQERPLTSRGTRERREEEETLRRPPRVKFECDQWSFHERSEPKVTPNIDILSRNSNELKSKEMSERFLSGPLEIRHHCVLPAFEILKQCYNGDIQFILYLIISQSVYRVNKFSAFCFLLNMRGSDFFIRTWLKKMTKKGEDRSFFL